MVKKSKKRSASGMTDVLDIKEVSKIRKLLKENNEPKPACRIEENEHIDSEDSEQEELTKNLDLNDFLHEDSVDDEWKKFYSSAQNDDSLISDLEKNMSDAKLKVAEEMSLYTGSIVDLEDQRGFESIEELPEELRDHLTLVIDVLRKFRCGALPKTVKMLPHLPGWDGLLELLKPMEWSVHAYPKIVKIFASKGQDPASHFYEYYLLPKVKSDIKENGHLCFHLFEALRISMFRVEEFISGLYLPWIRSEMTRLEGVILSHLIKKMTFKTNFAAVALALTLKEDFSISRSLVIETFLAKRYHFPELALYKVVEYFLSFDKDCSVYFTDEGRLPLTWFKSFLSFMDHYRHCLKPDQREGLVKICRLHVHPQITTEIRALLALVPSQ